MVHDPLIRKQLPPGWIDLVVGEAHVVRKALLETYPPDIFNVYDAGKECDYQPPNGLPELVSTLEARSGGRVVITSGAKQGLAAAFYAVKQRGLTHVTMRSPYWSQMPAAVRLAGLAPWFGDEPVARSAYLLVSPNNPDGHVTTCDRAMEMFGQCQDLGVPMIHDAAYHDPVYGCTGFEDLSNTVVHSAAKSYGLSGLRVGYLETSDSVMFQSACEYVEAATVGASLLSQRVLCRLLQHEDQHPAAHRAFIARAQQLLQQAKAIAATLDPEVLDASGVEQSTGMFGWFKVGPKFNPDAAQVVVAPGSAFGDPTRVRLNLAIEPALLREAVSRLNALA